MGSTFSSKSSSTISVKKNSASNSIAKSIFGVDLQDITNGGDFCDSWNQDGIYVGCFQIHHSGFHNYIIFSGFEMSKSVSMYAVGLSMMTASELEGKKSSFIGNVPDTLPMSFAFDIVVDPDEGKTYLRFRDPILINSKITIGEFEEKVFMFGLFELKKIILDFYSKFGDYNLVTKNCRHFAKNMVGAISTSLDRYTVDKHTFSLLTSSSLFICKELKRDSQNLFWPLFFSGCPAGAIFFVSTIMVMILEGRVKVAREGDIMTIFERGGSERSVFELVCGFLGYYIKTFGVSTPTPNYINNSKEGKIRKICIVSEDILENGKMVRVSDMKVFWDGGRQCFERTYGHIRIG